MLKFIIINIDLWLIQDINIINSNNFEYWLLAFITGNKTIINNILNAILFKFAK